MGLIDKLREDSRRGRFPDDRWYTQKKRYVLELVVHGRPAGAFVLPLAPTSYRISEVYRQSIEPTIGGLVAEERGLLWREISIGGTFGLEPKRGYDSTSEPQAAMSDPTGPISGPEWTRRMLRNVFGRYASAKANPDEAHGTELIWHDIRRDDHWLVVPEKVDLNRESAHRHQYPFEITLKALEDADRNVRFVEGFEANPLQTAREFASIARMGTRLVDSALAEGAEILGEVRLAAESFDAVIDDVSRVVESVRAVVEGVEGLASVGRAAVQAAADSMDSVLALMEDLVGFPNEVRMNYVDVVRGLDAMAAQYRLFGQTWAQVAAGQLSYEAGVARTSRANLEAAAAAGPATTAVGFAELGVRATDIDRIDDGAVSTGHEFRAYTGFRDYSVSAADTLQSIAARELGDASWWPDLALINDLSAPYVTATGLPGTVAPGDVISIPTFGVTEGSGVATSDAGDAPDPLGVDIRVEDAPGSAFGRPLVDWAIDRRTYRDCRTVGGVDNLTQALQLRWWTELGAMPTAPLYGLPDIVGFGNSAENVDGFAVGARRATLRDSRVRRLVGLTVNLSGDVAEVTASVVPIGQETARVVTGNLV